MGVLTDFVVADIADAARVGESEPHARFAWTDAKGIDQVMMGTLYAILTDTPYDQDFMVTEDSFLYEASEDGPWVQLVPQDLVERLARLTDDIIPKIALEWSQTDEFQSPYVNWPLDVINSLLRQLATLASLAVTQGKVLLMWTCL